MTRVPPIPALLALLVAAQTASAQSPIGVHPVAEISTRTTAADALARARGVFGPTENTAETARHTRLSVLVHPAAPEPRLVWEVRFADELSRASYRALVDADSGQVLFRENLAARASRHRARVFDVNPAVDGNQRVEVTFADIADASNTLTDDEVTVVGCVDTRSCREVKTIAGPRNLHYCETIPTAIAGAGSGFEGFAPEGDTAPEDPFAEVQGYYHVKKALDAFRVFAGDTNFRLDRPLLTVVNHRIPDLSSMVSRCNGQTAKADSTLSPEDNAYFWPAGDIGPTDLGDRILLAQGERADWAYDGEVVYHEVTHAVMHTTTPLAWFRHDEFGIDFGPGGLHEGFSDYFASTITGDSKPAAYAGTTDDGPTPLGDLEAFRTCSGALVGEEHEESLAWSNALWMIRRSLRSAAKRALFDQALFQVISRLERFDSFGEASALVLEEMAERFDDDTLADAEAKLAERELFDCNDRVQSISPGQSKAELYAKGPNHYGIDQFLDQAMPVGMQFALNVPAETTGIRLRAAASFELVEEIKAATMHRVPKLSLLIKSGGEPIRWTWQLPRGSHDADREVPLERTDPDDDFTSMVATAMGEIPAGTTHVQIVNRGADWGLEDISVAFADANGEFDDDKDDDLGSGEAGCATSGHSGGALLVLALALVLGWGRRRGLPRVAIRGRVHHR